MHGGGEVDVDALVAAATRGERWALSVLFRTYQPGLVRFLRSQDRAAADDLAGEVWVAVAQRLEYFVGDERAFRSWLFAIARNKLTDHRRKAGRRRTTPEPPEDIEAHLESHRLADPADLVVEALDGQQALDRLVDQLPPAQAEVVLLRVVGGLDVAEVASITSRSEGAVRVLQHRALRRLGRTTRPSLVTG